MAFEKFTAKRQEYEEMIAKEGRKELEAFFVEHFAKLPEVAAVKWSAYTPYFNDGDACHFSVHEPEFRFYGLPDIATTEDDEEGDESEYTESWNLRNSKPDLYAKLKPFLEGFNNIPEDIMLAAFGDHVRVTATRDGFTKEHYEHD